jgi:glucose-6-phosphate dehydrogenase assembly protein OpcA
VSRGATKGPKPVGREYPERIRWVGKGVTADDIDSELERLRRATGGSERVVALVRTLNLLVVPCADWREQDVERALDRLGSHTPSRTLVLRRHGADRVDADLVMECESPIPGHVGLCHDRVLLTMDDERLEHSASLLAPLLVTDLPTVLWLPEPQADIPDFDLLGRAQQALVDSASGGEAELRRLAKLGEMIRIHDLAWGRLGYWRAAVAAAFDPPERRRLLPRVTAVTLRHEEGGLGAGLLLAGWITGRLGWDPGRLERRNGHSAVAATRQDGGEAAIQLVAAPHCHACGGVDALTFHADAEEVAVASGGATSSLRDMFAEALQPQRSFSRGYAPAVGAAAAMLDGAR